jgi:hypothetical protein
MTIPPRGMLPRCLSRGCFVSAPPRRSMRTDGTRRPSASARESGALLRMRNKSFRPGYEAQADHRNEPPVVDGCGSHARPPSAISRRPVPRWEMVAAFVKIYDNDFTSSPHSAGTGDARRALRLVIVLGSPGVPPTPNR